MKTAIINSICEVKEGRLKGKINTNIEKIEDINHILLQLILNVNNYDTTNIYKTIEMLCKQREEDLEEEEEKQKK